MIYLSATEAKQNFTEFLDKAQKEPITIQRQEQDLVVVLSVLEYQRLTKLLKNEFQGFCDQVGQNAEIKGMTEEKLKEILESDD
ncbi:MULTISPECIES: type II toxin-antitoxin system Phd/YefM family antitoxin [Nostocales]|jgi:prevent-host-death family protein|uniref:Type II toxin-antitoxin system Phd/YefM family antitoxin n=1 Tax=Dolichospermum flos-aquae UHCC 0037 TaxID=2590026 RepID=A0ACC7S2D6_DOLFA|nr:MULTISPECIES: type II toxin-antitoxin system Phd/YefM family antitoxin [Nostocales]MBO1067377.1 type II toxin-antitoxin system Phd/YefM family antitoxin [Anabaena sp. 54]MTJ42667.1 type II toxin-antitoxin system Phd/YefM family antitoxin [Dolichospermum flos-aquae UHCC 0037]OBQ21252.1 MAG: prevent-host-death family protein [Anabaena sp. AL93]